MDLNHKKINLIKKLIVNLMNIKKDQIYISKKKNNYKKNKNIKINIITGKHQNRTGVIFDYIFKKNKIFLIFSYHNHIFFRKVAWKSTEFLFFFLNFKYEIISTIYKKI